jgi:hypothetical protein
MPTEREFLNDKFGANVFTKEDTEAFDIQHGSLSHHKIDERINQLKNQGYTVKKKKYNDFTAYMAVKRKRK